MRTVDEMLTEHRDVIARATADSRAIVTRAVEDAKRYRVGSPEAIADCERRRLEAITAAQAVTEDIEDRLDSRIPDLPAEYDTDSDSGDENDAWGHV